MKLKVMEWNQHFQSDSNCEVASFVKNEIVKHHIVVFTEIVVNSSVNRLMKEMEEYNFFESYNRTGNMILIAIKKDIKVINVTTKMPNVASYITPNFLHIEIMIGSEKFQIIGVRIRIGANKNYEIKYKLQNGNNLLIKHGEDDDYIERKIQAIQIANYINDMQNVIMLGDFNTSYIRGDMNDSYLKVRNNYENPKYDDKGDYYYFLSTRFYNYQMMSDIMGENFTVHTPQDKCSWGLSFDNNKFKYGYIENDHLITSSNIFVEKVDYDWSFVEQNKDKYTSKTIDKGFPDHAILM